MTIKTRMDQHGRTDRAAARWRIALGLAGPAMLAALLPAPADLFAQVSTGSDAVTILGSAMLLAVAIVVWGLLAWALLVGIATLLTRMPGVAGRGGRALLRVIAPAAARRILIVAAGVSLVTGASACAAPAGAGGVPGPSGPAVTASAVTTSPAATHTAPATSAVTSAATAATATPHETTGAVSPTLSGPAYGDGGYAGPDTAAGVAVAPGQINLDWPVQGVTTAPQAASATTSISSPAASAGPTAQNATQRPVRTTHAAPTTHPESTAHPEPTTHSTTTTRPPEPPPSSEPKAQATPHPAASTGSQATSHQALASSLVALGLAGVTTPPAPQVLPSGERQHAAAPSGSSGSSPSASDGQQAHHDPAQDEAAQHHPGHDQAAQTQPVQQQAAQHGRTGQHQRHDTAPSTAPSTASASSGRDHPTKDRPANERPANDHPANDHPANERLSPTRQSGGPSHGRSGAASSTSRHAGLVVTVHRGDSLWTIAAAHLPAGATNRQIDTAWRAWYAANRSVIGSNPNLIIPGQRLSAPTTEGTPS